MKRLTLIFITVLTLAVGCDSKPSKIEPDLLHDKNFVHELDFASEVPLILAKVTNPERNKLLYDGRKSLKSVIESADYESNEYKLHSYREELDKLEEKIIIRYGDTLDFDNDILKIIESKLTGITVEEFNNLLTFHLMSVNSRLAWYNIADYYYIDSISFSPNLQGDSIKLIPTIYNSTDFVRIIIDGDTSKTNYNNLQIGREQFERAQSIQLEFYHGRGKLKTIEIKNEAQQIRLKRRRTPSF